MLSQNFYQATKQLLLSVSVNVSFKLEDASVFASVRAVLSLPVCIRSCRWLGPARPSRLNAPWTCKHLSVAVKCWHSIKPEVVLLCWLMRVCHYLWLARWPWSRDHLHFGPSLQHGAHSMPWCCVLLFLHTFTYTVSLLTSYHIPLSSAIKGPTLHRLKLKSVPQDHVAYYYP